jgi:hypothetical protein
MTTPDLSSLPSTPAEASEVRGSELRSTGGFGPNDLHRGSPLCVRDAYALLLRELDRKQGMIDDLKQLAEINYGLTPEDCELLTATVCDRDSLKLALGALRDLFA